MENKEFKHYAIDYRLVSDFDQYISKQEFMSCVNEEDVLPFAENLAKSEGNLILEQIWEIDPTTSTMEYKRLVYSKDK
jgi:hypothetical protein